MEYSCTVSIIIPVYKVENYISRCLDSVLSQTFTDFECLLIDDGSPDNSGAICDEYAKKDSRIKVFHKENGGVSSARNLGLDSANGKYITFIDGDDWADSDYLRILINNMHDCDLVRSIYTAVYKHSTRINLSEEYILDIKNDRENKFLTFAKIGWWGPYTKLYKSEIITKYNIRFNKEISLCEDAIFVYNYLCHCNKVNILAKPIYFYNRVNETSASRSVHRGLDVVGIKLLEAVSQFVESTPALKNSSVGEFLVCHTAYTLYDIAIRMYMVCSKVDAVKYLNEVNSVLSSSLKVYSYYLESDYGFVKGLVNKHDCKDRLYVSIESNMGRLYDYKKRQARKEKLKRPFKRIFKLLKRIF